MREEAGVLDRTRLEHLRALGGADFVDRMIGIFLRNAPLRIAAARAARQSGDWRSVARSVHSLAGSAANLGAVGLYRLCREVERLVGEGALGAVPSLLEELEDGFGRLCPCLEAARKESAA